ncbi:MAG: endo alpha-1,4 polygalactosaminidase [Deltaproteobacteria bacterium]|nr:endo alpha-1,4 polygalactosaminidase [Deltaproteobacteria bacterium]
MWLFLAACTNDAERWAPPPGTTWQWQLSGQVDTGIDVAAYDVDLFDAPDRAIDDLREAGRVVICYFSAGSHEDWRDDAGDFPEAALGEALDGWAGERWLDTRDSTVRSLMEARLDHAVQRGCDAVEPDNVDGYANDNGFDLAASDQLDYNRFLAGAAHDRGLSVGLKNDLDQVRELEPDFDWALNEECVAYDECARVEPFIDAGKAVFHVEYVDAWADAEALAEEVCAARPASFSTLVKTWDLGREFLDCG